MGIFGHKFDSLVNNFNPDVILEGSVFKDSSFGSIGFFEDPSRNNGGDAGYFKVINKNNETARIKFTKPEYVVHKGKTWVLNGKEKKELAKILVSKPKIKNKNGEKIESEKTVWELLNDEYEKLSGLKSEYNTIPDYTKLPNSIKK